MRLQAGAKVEFSDCGQEGRSPERLLFGGGDFNSRMCSSKRNSMRVKFCETTINFLSVWLLCLRTDTHTHTHA